MFLTVLVMKKEVLNNTSTNSCYKTYAMTTYNLIIKLWRMSVTFGVDYRELYLSYVFGDIRF